MKEGNCCAKKGVWGLIVILFALAFMVIWYNQHHEASTATQSEHYGTWLSTPQHIQPFNLQSTQGGDFTEKNFQGHWSWVFFGFTHCPDMCPHTLKAFKIALEKLRADKIDTLPQIIFVSLDPARDTIPVLQQYVTTFDPSFIGLAGSMDQIDNLAKQMNVAYKDLGDGKMQHSGTITVVDPEGDIFASFPWIDEPEKAALDYEAMLQAHKAS